LSQLINGQFAYDCRDVTVPAFKLRLDQIKTNLRHGKYFKLREVDYTFHVIEYQYRGLPHAHMVIGLDNAHDIDAIIVKICLILSTEILLQKYLELKEKKIKMFIGGTIKKN
jgi:hypothetical protein